MIMKHTYMNKFVQYYDSGNEKYRKRKRSLPKAYHIRVKISKKYVVGSERTIKQK